MKWFYSFLKKYWLRMVSGLILVTILAATALASPYISKLIVDDVIKKQNTGLLPKLIILLLDGCDQGCMPIFFASIV